MQDKKLSVKKIEIKKTNFNLKIQVILHFLGWIRYGRWLDFGSRGKGGIMENMVIDVNVF